MSFKTAGIIIVGDEILKGHVNDTNSSYMCKRFHAIGVRVSRITTVPDNVNEIAEEVKKFAGRYNIVVTSGGIGPTHDDITYEGVAKGLNEQIVLHSEMASVVRSYFPFGGSVSENPALKMALIPKNSKLIYVTPKKATEEGRPDRLSQSTMSFPVVQVCNVYILPGMTEWMKLAFDHLQKLFENPDVSFYTMKLFINSSELKIIDALNKAVHKYEQSVIFGSYPSVVSDVLETKITLESTSLDDVTEACSYLKQLLPKEYLSDSLSHKEMESVYEMMNGTNSLANAVSSSLRIIELAYDKYRSDEIYLSFNGGKDCTVILHLIWAFSVKRNITGKINAFYLRPDDPFPEMEEFVGRSVERYNLNLLTDVGSASAKEQLSVLVDANPSLKAFFLGTRRTDPHASELKEFQMCDPDWPRVMRINPLLDWSYADIWDFLRVLAVPYCSLYDDGYTSVGNLKNTKKNPALKVKCSDGVDCYEPAYKLKDGSLERQGRA